MDKIKTAIILCGGFSTRLRPLTSTCPKTFLSLGGRPFIEYQLDKLITLGIKNVVLSMYYLYEEGVKILGDAYKELSIKYIIDSDALGTGGAIRNSLENIEDEHVLVMNGDILYNANLEDDINLYNKKKADLVISSVEMTDTSRYGTIDYDITNRITGFYEKDPHNLSHWINAGVYCINKDLYLSTTNPGTFSIEREWFPKIIDRNKSYICRHDDYWNDVGTLETWILAYHNLDLEPDENYNIAEKIIRDQNIRLRVDYESL